MSPILHFPAILQIDPTWPLIFICDLWPHEHVKVSIISINQVWFTSWTCEGSYYINKPSLVPIGLQLFKWREFYIFNPSYNLNSDDLWPWYMIIDHMNIQRVPYCINQPSLVPSDLNFSNEATFTFSAYLTTWPQMTFDLDMWPLTISTNAGPHDACIYDQLWLKFIKARGK